MLYRAWCKKTQSHVAYTKNGNYNFTNTTSKLEKKQQYKKQYEEKTKKETLHKQLKKERTGNSTLDPNHAMGG